VIDSNTEIWGYFDLDYENETEVFTPAEKKTDPNKSKGFSKRTVRA